MEKVPLLRFRFYGMRDPAKRELRHLLIQSLQGALFFGGFCILSNEDKQKSQHNL
jgi:hypothetical protein